MCGTHAISVFQTTSKTKPASFGMAATFCRKSNRTADIYINTDQDSYGPPAQVRNWTNEDGEIGQQAHYFHCDQIGILREITDKDGNLLWFGNYTGWDRLKYFFNNNLGQNRLRIRSGRSYSKNTRT